ncbi:MAG: FHA domain-containing protein [Phycisphaerae bacterium]|nr:FHA domain-containing protein [Phycisphaerae bacterium]
MQLVIKQADQFVKEFHFDQGPIYIGREVESQVCLAHESVNYEHCVLCGAQNQWFAQDLDRQGRTKLNNQPIRKSPIKDGDVLVVGDFTIEIHMVSGGVVLPSEQAKEEVLKHATRAMKNIIRRYDQGDSPDIRMPPARHKDFQTALTAIQKADTPELFNKTLLAVALKHFNMLHTWVGIRKSPTGELTHKIGKRRTGQSVELHEILFRDLIDEALSRQEYILIPILPKEKIYERIRSALIAPILSMTGCHGVIYIDNAAEDNHYSLTDLDYLMLLTTAVGVRMKELFAKDPHEPQKESPHDATRISV